MAEIAETGKQAKQGEEKRDPHRLQTKWLLTAKGSLVAILLTNGQMVRGVLIGADQYVLWLKEESGGVALIYKHSCAVLRREGGGNDQ